MTKNQGCFPRRHAINVGTKNKRAAKDIICAPEQLQIANSLFIFGIEKAIHVQVTVGKYVGRSLDFTQIQINNRSVYYDLT